jgi:hypothetical protein
MYDHRLKTWDGVPLTATITIESCGLGFTVHEETYPQRYKGFRPQTTAHHCYYISLVDFGVRGHFND